MKVEEDTCIHFNKLIIPTTAGINAYFEYDINSLNGFAIVERTQTSYGFRIMNNTVEDIRLWFIQFTEENIEVVDVSSVNSEDTITMRKSPLKSGSLVIPAGNGVDDLSFGNWLQQSSQMAMLIWKKAYV